MQFDIDQFVAQAKTKTYIGLIEYAEMQLNWLDNLVLSPKGPLKSREAEIKAYRSFIRNLVDYLYSGQPPSNISAPAFTQLQEISAAIAMQPVALPEAS